jgi:hypothetical protein
MKRILLALFMAFISFPVFGDCRANLFADDWNGSLGSVNDVNKFCYDRASWWGINTEPKNYCFTSKQSRYDSYGREYFVWPTSFFYKLQHFQGYDSWDVLNQAKNYLGGRVYRGWSASVKIIFDPKCY